MKNIVVLSGAGMSAESGIQTFRDAGGLWENHRIEDVATPEAWYKNMDLVLEFYNTRRRKLYESKPNAAHYALVKLETKYKVTIITQNIDDLHEAAGSGNVLHLHGELKKARSTGDESIVYDLKGKDIKRGDLCEKGFQLRPHIVWFGEPVPNIESATYICEKADVLIIIGTSMQVYPAAGLMHYAKPNIPKYYIDPNPDSNSNYTNLKIIKEKASAGVVDLVERLLSADEI